VLYEYEKTELFQLIQLISLGIGFPFGILYSAAIRSSPLLLLTLFLQKVCLKCILNTHILLLLFYIHAYILFKYITVFLN